MSTTDPAKLFSLKKPCANCPFRNDNQAIDLMPGRKEQIMRDLMSGQHTAFHCHKTVYRDGVQNFDEQERYRPTDVCQCAGAAAVARKLGCDVTIVQVAIRLRVIPYDHYDDALPLTINASDLAL